MTNIINLEEYRNKRKDAEILKRLALTNADYMRMVQKIRESDRLLDKGEEK